MWYKSIQFTIINKKKIWAAGPLDFAGQVNLRRLNLHQSGAMGHRITAPNTKVLEYITLITLK